MKKITLLLVVFFIMVFTSSGIIENSMDDVDIYNQKRNKNIGEKHTKSDPYPMQGNNPSYNSVVNASGDSVIDECGVLASDTNEFRDCESEKKTEISVNEDSNVIEAFVPGQETDNFNDMETETELYEEPQQRKKSQLDGKNRYACVLEGVRQLHDSTQAIIVASLESTDFKAKLYAYEYGNQGWSEAMASANAVVGERGMGKEKEGDKKSPAGIFYLEYAFGTELKPKDIKMDYKQTTAKDYWIDDVTSEDYNKWVTFEGDPYSRWRSFERLHITPYKYALVIDYNKDCVPGKGSAIFLHIWLGPKIDTSGCTAVSEDSMLKLLKWMNPEKNPVLIQGTETQIRDMFE